MCLLVRHGLVQSREQRTRASQYCSLLMAPQGPSYYHFCISCCQSSASRQPSVSCFCVFLWSRARISSAIRFIFFLSFERSFSFLFEAALSYRSSICWVQSLAGSLLPASFFLSSPVAAHVFQIEHCQSFAAHIVSQFGIPGPWHGTVDDSHCHSFALVCVEGCLAKCFSRHMLNAH